MLRESFFEVEEKMKKNPIFHNIRFLDSFIISDEESCHDATAKLM